MRDSYRILRTQLLKVCTSSVALSAYTSTLQPAPYTTPSVASGVGDSRGDNSRHVVNSVHSTHGKHSGIEPQTLLTSSSGDLLVTSDDTVYPLPYFNPYPTPDAHPAVPEETYTPNTDTSVYIQALYESKWLQHLSDILQAAVYVANQLEAGQPCLVHCSGMIYTYISPCCIYIHIIQSLYKKHIYFILPTIVLHIYIDGWDRTSQVSSIAQIILGMT